MPNVTHVYVGTGTTGTAMGISRCFRQLRPNVRIVGVEPIGSVTFGKHASAPRKIPGIGTSVAPPLADRKALCDLRYIPETDAIRSCHHLLREFGLLLGGSTGSVFAAVLADTPTFDANDTVVMIAPDSGEKYLDTIYNPQWVLDTYGELASFGFAGDAERPTVGRLQQTVNSSALVPNREGVA